MSIINMQNEFIYQFTKDKVILNRKDRFNGYFYDDRVKEENAIKRYVTESLEMQLDTEIEDKLTYDEGFYRSSNTAIIDMLTNWISPDKYIEYLEQFDKVNELIMKK